MSVNSKFQYFMILYLKNINQNIQIIDTIECQQKIILYVNIQKLNFISYYYWYKFNNHILTCKNNLYCIIV